MRRLPKFALVVLFMVFFCAGFTIVFELITLYIEAKNTQSFENNTDPNYGILAFKRNDVQILTLGELEDFKRQNPEYSFLVPKSKENYFAQMLQNGNQGMIYEIEVEQISDGRQLLTISSDNTRSIVKNTYEATDKEVFPKTSMWINFRHTPLKLLASSACGAIICLIFFFIYKKSLAVHPYNQRIL
jgi:hypothetical protein